MPIQAQIVETNTDLLTANLFTFEIVGLNLTSPNFSRIDGLSRTTETVTQVDGGTGLTRKYHGGVINYDDITIVSVRDNSSNDQLLSNFVTNYLISGNKVSGAMVKQHKGQELRRIEFEGLNASSEQLPSYDNASAAGEEINYPMQVDYWEEIF